ncbi:MAG: HAD-IA family hydrolase, partial [Patescibacteria group bacterium]|nr:HAD-IA family hydrolase [Patescibacteria group bacterium]
NPWQGTTQKEVEELILKNVIQLVKNEGQPKEGVTESLNLIKRLGYRLALASSSGMVLINPVLDKLQIRDYFEVIHSAEFEKYGKPHPNIYLTTAKQLDLSPAFCIAIEDSINGIISAKAAKMKCIAIPEKDKINDKRLGIADVVLSSLSEIDKDTIRALSK